MPRYQFIIRSASIIQHTERIVCVDDDTATAEAVRIIRGLKKNPEYRLDWSLLIAEGSREVIWIRFDSVE
jgi:hypothetical protein